MEKELIRAEAAASVAQARLRGMVRPSGPPLSVRAVGPEPAVFALSGTLLGLLSGISLAVLANVLSSRLSTPADVERRLGLPVLTTIPREG